MESYKPQTGLQITIEVQCQHAYYTLLHLSSDFKIELFFTWKKNVLMQAKEENKRKKHAKESHLSI